MAQKKHVQLIDKIEIPSGVILNLWDLEERVQLSIEIDNPTGEYVVGEVFVVDRTAKTEDLALTRSSARVNAASLLIPRRNTKNVPGFLPRFVVKERLYAPRPKYFGQTTAPGFSGPLAARIAKLQAAKLQAKKVAKRAQTIKPMKAQRLKKAHGVTAPKQNVFLGQIIK